MLADFPVGERLLDHYMVMLNHPTDLETLMTAASPEKVELLLSERRGPLTSNIGEAGDFLETREGLAEPDVQFHSTPCFSAEEGVGAQTAQDLTAGPCVLKPTSTGTLTLHLQDPEVTPRIKHDYLSTAEDRAAMVAGIRAAPHIADQAPMKEGITSDHVVPAGSSDEELLAFARRVDQTLYHPTSTCGIGHVIDNELKVLGLDRLRVADAPVLPTVVRGNTDTPRS